MSSSGSSASASVSPAASVNDSAAAPDVVINEFSAANQSGLKDEEGAAEDWIELYNRGAVAIDLNGWALTDAPDFPNLWVFPPLVLGPGEYVVLFGSGKDRRDPSKPLHTNFKLARSGEYLSLLNAESPRRLVSQLAPAYPEQRNDISFGLDSSRKWKYYQVPTPGGENGESQIVGIAEPVEFSVERGVFDHPFRLFLSSPTVGVSIRFTTDGSEPTIESMAYDGGIWIETNSVVRAVAFKENHLPSRIVTQSYLFLNTPALLALPILSIATDQANLTGPKGIFGIEGGKYVERSPGDFAWIPIAHGDYHNPSKSGIQWERPVSLELLRPDGIAGFQIDCGLRVHGSDWMRPTYVSDSKFGLRAYFRGDYGAGGLEYPLIPGSPERQFERVVLRSGHNDSINPFITDELMRRLMVDTGQAGSLGTFAHLFINGVYEGYYNPTERLDEEFFQGRYNSTNEWNILKPYMIVDEGSADTWASLLSYADSHDFSNPAHYQEITARLDLTNFVDYLLVNIYGDTGDWTESNWRAAQERKEGAPFRFYLWDAEFALGIYSRSPANNSLVDPAELGKVTEISRLFNPLKASAEFRLLFADRVHKHFFNGGALTDENIQARYEQLREIMLPAIPHFLKHIGEVWIPNRRGFMLQHLKKAGLYRSDLAPVFNRHGGVVAPGFSWSIAPQGEGTVYYTVDGSDPRVPFSSEIASTAFAYDPESSVTTLWLDTVIKARTLTASGWSALAEASFRLADLGSPIRITELMYNPASASGSEFVELANLGATSVDVSGMRVAGIDFVFPQGSIMEPNEIWVLVSSRYPDSFQQSYPGIPVKGYFSGGMSNGGERIALFDRAGAIVTSVDYDDDGWPREADGAGFSLEINDPRGDPDDPYNWNASSALGGSPGTVPAPAQSSIRLNEFMAWNESAVLNGTDFPDWIELANHSEAAVDLSGWTLIALPYGFKHFVLPNGTVIESGMHLVVWLDARSDKPGLHAGFELNAAGEDVALFNSQGKRVDGVRFGQQPRDLSVGRDERGVWHLMQPSPGAANGDPIYPDYSAVVINEWLADSLPGQGDWLELFNSSNDLPLSLRGLWFSNGAAHFQVQTLSFVPQNGFFRFWADERPGGDHLDFKLAGEGGVIRMGNPDGEPIFAVNYSRQAEGVSFGSLPDGSANLSAFARPTPGASNETALESGVVLNEVLVRNLAGPGWIEFYNSMPTAYDLSGFIIEIKADSSSLYKLPQGVAIGPGEYLLVECNSGALASVSVPTDDPLNLGQSLFENGGTISLLHWDGRLVDWISYGFQLPNFSIGRTDSGWGLLAEPTPAGSNAAAAPLADQKLLRVNEWMVQPVGGFDWIEIFNAGSQPVSLTDCYLTDDPSVTGKTLHKFGALSFVAPGDWVVIRADATRSPWSVGFRLSAEGESLRLYSPSLGLIDAVDYGPQQPDVSEGRLPDGSAAFARFPGSATPRASNALWLKLDRDEDGMWDIWEEQHGFSSVDGSDALSDKDGDGVSNRAEFIAGTDASDRNDFLRLKISLADEVATLVFEAKPERRYYVRFKTELGTQSWSTVAEIAPRAHTEMVIWQHPDAGLSPVNYYQLEAEYDWQ